MLAIGIPWRQPRRRGLCGVIFRQAHFGSQRSQRSRYPRFDSGINKNVTRDKLQTASLHRGTLFQDKVFVSEEIKITTDRGISRIQYQGNGQ